MKKSKVDLVIALGLILIVIALRLLPHPANFAPVAAASIFGGAILPRRIAIWVPLVAMMTSDLFIGFYNIMPIIWACYLVIALASSHWLRKPTILKGFILTISGSLLFFFVSNFAVWVWGGIYTHSWSGLVSCYTLALPFFRNTALSDLLYTAGLFGVYALATRLSTRAIPLSEQTSSK